MSSRDEIRQRAEMYGWGVSRITYGDSYLRGGENVQVEYRLDGAILSAQRYRFFSLDSLQLIDEIFPSNAFKKEKLLSWLAAAVRI